MPQAHVDAMANGASVIIHPPTDPKLRAYCDSPNRCTVLGPRPYLARNKDIVLRGVDGFIAAPKDFVQPKNLRGQGTWTTIGYARQAKRRIWIVFPDGAFVEENSQWQPPEVNSGAVR